MLLKIICIGFGSIDKISKTCNLSIVKVVLAGYTRELKSNQAYVLFCIIGTIIEYVRHLSTLYSVY